MRGPKPEPAAVKKAKGNPSHRRVGADPRVDEGAESAPAIDLHHANVAAPEWLKGAGRKLWSELAPGCIAMRLLTSIDAGAFARYCQSYARRSEEHTSELQSLMRSLYAVFCFN